MRRTITVTLAACVGMCCAHGRMSSAGSGGVAADLAWTKEQGGVRLAPKRERTSYLVLTARPKATAPAPAGTSAAVPVTQASGTTHVDAARRVVVYRLVPALYCEAGECAPCRPETPDNPDCSVPPPPPPFIEGLTMVTRARTP